MKTIIPILLSVLLLGACAQHKSNETKKAIITGQVSNFETVSEHDVIQLVYEDILAGQIILPDYPDKNGRFRFELELDYPTEFYLKYSGLLTFYISPGDSLHFDIDGACWNKKTNTTAEEYAFYSVSGTAEKMNQDITAYVVYYSDSLQDRKEQDSMIRNASPEEYKRYEEKVAEERMNRAEAFNTTHNTCKQFQEWLPMKIKFDKYENLMRYRWLQAMHKQKDPNDFITSVPAEYFDFLNEWDKDNTAYLVSTSFLNFLSEYDMYLFQLIPSDSLQLVQQLYATDFEKSMSIPLRYLKDVEKGFVKDVLLSKFYYRLLDTKNYENMGSLYHPEFIDNADLKFRVEKKYNQEKALFEHPEYATGSKINTLSDENDYLARLVEKYPDNVIYIDFWAPWCGPCMGEMPNSKKIKKQFEGKDVVFVYLANQCTESAWKTTIADQKIEGEHYLLNDKQFAQLGQIFGIQGIPHYALIDKKGKIISYNAPRPGSGNELVKLIEANLN
ncbi:TlpA family protein disulfide reductase [Saccharicrinis sp. FJH54]|uniref:TlpA family protein disulfide reductase n=1 Tax=Saccharicrinis sp. FJH54 TaxID=3344665 RepID=UPI0035D500F8